MPNPWLTHIKKTMKRMKMKGTYAKGKGLKQVIMEAKKTWHKSKKGGGESDSDEEMKDVPLSPASAAPSKPSTSGMEINGEKVTGGRHRKTRRRRHHSRRR